MFTSLGIKWIVLVQKLSHKLSGIFGAKAKPNSTVPCERPPAKRRQCLEPLVDFFIRQAHKAALDSVPVLAELCDNHKRGKVIMIRIRRIENVTHFHAYLGPFLCFNAQWGRRSFSASNMSSAHWANASKGS